MRKNLLCIFLFCGLITLYSDSHGQLKNHFLEISATKIISDGAFGNANKGNFNANLKYGIRINKFSYFAEGGINKFYQKLSASNTGEVQVKDIYSLSVGSEYKINLIGGLQVLPELSGGLYFYKKEDFNLPINDKFSNNTALGISPGMRIGYNFNKFSLMLKTKYSYILSSDNVRFFQFGGGIEFYP